MLMQYAAIFDGSENDTFRIKIYFLIFAQNIEAYLVHGGGS